MSAVIKTIVLLLAAVSALSTLAFGLFAAGFVPKILIEGQTLPSLPLFDSGYLLVLDSPVHYPAAWMVVCGLTSVLFIFGYRHMSKQPSRG